MTSRKIYLVSILVSHKKQLTSSSSTFPFLFPFPVTGYPLPVTRYKLTLASALAKELALFIFIDVSAFCLSSVKNICSPRPAHAASRTNKCKCTYERQTDKRDQLTIRSSQFASCLRWEWQANRKQVRPTAMGPIRLHNARSQLHLTQVEGWPCDYWSCRVYRMATYTRLKL